MFEKTRTEYYSFVFFYNGKRGFLITVKVRVRLDRWSSDPIICWTVSSKDLYFGLSTWAGNWKTVLDLRYLTKPKQECEVFHKVIQNGTSHTQSLVTFDLSSLVKCSPGHILIRIQDVLRMIRPDQSVSSRWSFWLFSTQTLHIWKTAWFLCCSWLWPLTPPKEPGLTLVSLTRPRGTEIPKETRRGFFWPPVVRLQLTIFFIID